MFLEECRRIVGPPPRRLPLRDWWYLRLRPPEWLAPVLAEGHPGYESIPGFYRDRGRLLRHGIVVWASIIQANRMLFEPGPDDCPAAVVYSFDPHFDDRPGELLEIARAVYDLKGKPCPDPALAPLASAVTDEYTFWLKEPLPKSLSAGRTVYSSGILIHRKHLPDGVLPDSTFPILACPEGTEWIMVLPGRYWPT
jgi:hypothetical protein